MRHTYDYLPQRYSSNGDRLEQECVQTLSVSLGLDKVSGTKSLRRHMYCKKEYGTLMYLQTVVASGAICFGEMKHGSFLFKHY